MNVSAWLIGGAAPVLIGWLCAVLPARPRRSRRNGLSERDAAARLHPTEARGVRRLPAGGAR